MASEFLGTYKVGLVLSVEPATGNKNLTACSINIGEEDAPITVVTAASNVKEGSRVAVAPVGSKILDKSGEEIEVKKTSVGGVKSEGVLCDSRMLGWVGGAEGLAAQMPELLEIGAVPPASKPRGKLSASQSSDTPNVPAVEVKPLFEKKLTKEEKKKLAEEKKKARKVAREKKKAEEKGRESPPCCDNC